MKHLKTRNFESPLWGFTFMFITGLLLILGLIGAVQLFFYAIRQLAGVFS